jgi:hypothetical protein
MVAQKMLGGHQCTTEAAAFHVMELMLEDTAV